jgi:hypothetical protein
MNYESQSQDDLLAGDLAGAESPKNMNNILSGGYSKGNFGGAMKFKGPHADDPKKPTDAEKEAYMKENANPASSDFDGDSPLPKGSSDFTGGKGQGVGEIVGSPNVGLSYESKYGTQNVVGVGDKDWVSQGSNYTKTDGSTSYSDTSRSSPDMKQTWNNPSNNKSRNTSLGALGESITPTTSARQLTESIESEKSKNPTDLLYDVKARTFAPTVKFVSSDKKKKGPVKIGAFKMKR